MPSQNMFCEENRQNGSNVPDVDVRILTTNVAKGKREKNKRNMI